MHNINFKKWILWLLKIDKANYTIGIYTYICTHTLHIKCMQGIFSNEIQWLILTIFNILIWFFKFFFVFLVKMQETFTWEVLKWETCETSLMMIFWISSVKILSVSKFSDAVLKCKRWSNFKVLSNLHDSLLIISSLPFRFQLQTINNF